jgi:hypothetical protein
VPIVYLDQQSVRVEVADIDLKIVFDYEFLSQPPILADIGESFIQI